MKKLKELFKKYNHAWVLLYALIYMPWFTYLEHHVTADFYLIHSPLDDYIPFVEYFIVPYLLWFAYLAVGACFLFFQGQKRVLAGSHICDQRHDHFSDHLYNISKWSGITPNRLCSR